MTMDAIGHKEANYHVRHRLPIWIGVSCILVTFVIGFFVVESGIGSDQTAKTVHKTPGQYYRAVQWSGHLSMAAQYVVTGFLVIILVGIFVTLWRYST